MRFIRLKLKDKSIFDRFLSKKQHFLSAYAFENIFIWKSLYDIFWVELDKSLCVFFKDRMGCFLYLPPLGNNLTKDIVDKCFQIMSKINKNSAVSRIENAEKQDADFYKNIGYRIILGGCDYICKRKDLVELKGSCFKNKRNALNAFLKDNKFQYLPYKKIDKRRCLNLYKLWMKERQKKYQDTIYRRLLKDNFTIFKATLDYYNKLNFVGRVIKIENKIKAATFGYSLTKNNFAIFFEVCDLKFKGIAQYIFREFCRELNFKDINIMDDSGLENLKKVKLSYRPYKIEENFVVSQ